MSSQNFIFPPPPPPPPIAEPQSYSNNFQLQDQQHTAFHGFGNGKSRGGTGQRSGRGREAAFRGSRGGRGRGGHDFGGISKPYGVSKVSNSGYNSQRASCPVNNGHPLANYPQAQYTKQGHHGYEGQNYPISPGYGPGVISHTSQVQPFMTPFSSHEQRSGSIPNQYSMHGEYYPRSDTTSDVRAQALSGVGSYKIRPFIRMGFDNGSNSHSRQYPMQSLQGGHNYETLRYQHSGKSFISSPTGDSRKPMPTEAFGSTDSAMSMPMAPPPVPSFGVALPGEPFQANEKVRRYRKKARKHNQLGLTPKTEEHESSSEEDVDEESKLAAMHPSGAKPALEQLQFSYKGQLAVLKSPSDIAAWIEERKKRFPTRKRAEEAAMQKEKLLEAGKVGKKNSKKNANRPTTTNDKRHGPLNEAGKAKLKAEKLRKQYEKAQQRVREFEAQGPLVHVASQTAPISVLETDKLAATTTSAFEGANEASTLVPHELCHETRTLEKPENSEPAYASFITTCGNPSATVNGCHEQKDPISNGIGPSMSTLQPMASVHDPEISSAQVSQSLHDLVEDSMDAVPSTINQTMELEYDTNTTLDTTSPDLSCTDMEDTSSSGSSSEDDRPTEVPSRDDRPALVVPLKRAKPKSICRVFLAKGRCPRGGRCHYRHELPERGSGRDLAAKDSKGHTVCDSNGAKTERVSLYQRMLIQQQEKDDETLVQHIIFLGEHGALK